MKKKHLKRIGNPPKTGYILCPSKNNLFLNKTDIKLIKANTRSVSKAEHQLDN